MANVDDVAAYITEILGRVPTMKLQKLCYFSHGWNLVWHDEPLFSEEIQAWKNGPVVRHLWNQHQGLPSVATWQSGDSSALMEQEKRTIEIVVNHYKAVSGFELGDESHRHMAWDNHFNPDLPAYLSNEAMPDNEIRDSFVELYA